MNESVMYNGKFGIESKDYSTLRPILITLNV